MERFKKIVVLIPSYNEGKEISNLLQKIKRYNTIVVDDGSTDKTHLRVNKLCTHFLRNKKLRNSLRVSLSAEKIRNCERSLETAVSYQRGGCRLISASRPLLVGQHGSPLFGRCLRRIRQKIGLLERLGRKLGG